MEDPNGCVIIDMLSTVVTYFDISGSVGGTFLEQLIYLTFQPLSCLHPLQYLVSDTTPIPLTLCGVALAAFGGNS